MTAGPRRLQGTDGVRGVVVPDDEESRTDPVGAFLRTGRLTPAFAGLYAAAFAEEEASAGEEVVVGWDPRDREGVFTGAVMRGVRRAGRKAVVLGTVPTPAVPLAMIQRGAKAGIMATASHNPEGQNGVKAFVGPLATKLYPVDEERLTRRVYERAGRQAEDPGGPEGEGEGEGAGEVLPWEAEARRAFVENSCDPYNAWVPAGGPEASKPSENPYSDLLLVVDAAGGSLAGMARDVFDRLGVRRVVEVNGAGSPVNRGGGVVELEQVDWVDERCGDESGKDLSGHAGVAALLEMALGRQADLAAGRLWAAAAVFDGDGDRCILLVYDPFRKGLAILDGDRVGLHLARFLAERNPGVYQGAIYVNTVDSDLAAGTKAARLGFEPVLSAVGDKWLLWRAGLSCARALAAGAEENEMRFLEEGEGDARRLGALIEKVGARSDGSVLAPGRIPFAVGSEASGHHVTLGRAKSKTGFSPLFAGDGLKAAVNALVSMRSLAPGKSTEAWMEAVRRPFEAGHRKTRYALYTDRARFAPGTEVWRDMDGLLARSCRSAFGRSVRARRLKIPEDPGMLYLALDDAGGVQRAGVFVRNSGTEERTGVTVQGRAEDVKALDSVADAAARALLRDLKSEAHPYRAAERFLLKRLLQERLSQRRAEESIRAGVESGRLLKEMERQGLIVRGAGDWTITELGRWCVGGGEVSNR